MAKITFGICVGDDNRYLDNLLYSIDHQPWQVDDEYQIITLTNEEVNGGWLPVKKNKIAKEAIYENLVLLHDYYMLDPDWLTFFAAYDYMHPEWDVLCGPINTADGKRSADWLLNPNAIDAAIKVYPELADILMKAGPHENGPRYVSSLPYGVVDLHNLQYISGGYIVCKRHLLLRVPMDETMQPGSAEDVDWSERIISLGAKIKFNGWSGATIQKPNKWAVTVMPQAAIDIMRKFNDGLQ